MPIRDRIVMLGICLAVTATGHASDASGFGEVRQLTTASHGHILTNIGVWSHDSQWIVYDVRSDPHGTVFDGTRIERVNVQTGAVEVLYESVEGGCVGVVTMNPNDDRVVFIHGPERPTAEWNYAQSRRRGVIVDASRPGIAINLDARDLTPPFTPGALRGGSHVHVFSGDGHWVSFTYNDQILAWLETSSEDADLDQRNVGVSVPTGPVQVSKDHERNHDGSFFSVLVTRTVNQPRAGSDEISRAYEEAWVGARGYLRPDGRRQRRALAFQGDVVTAGGNTISEVFIVDLPEDLTIPGEGPLEGTSRRRPFPPKGVMQRRLTFTADRRFPGLQGPRHWLRSSPDGSKIAFLMRDETGLVQIWTVSPNGGVPVQLTRNRGEIASAFSWSPDGGAITYVMDNSVFVTEIPTGRSRRLTPRVPDATAPRPEACVFSPNGKHIAFVRPVEVNGASFNQIFCVSFDSTANPAEFRQ